MEVQPEPSPYDSEEVQAPWRATSGPQDGSRTLASGWTRSDPSRRVGQSIGYQGGKGRTTGQLCGSTESCMSSAFSSPGSLSPGLKGSELIFCSSCHGDPGQACSVLQLQSASLGGPTIFLLSKIRICTGLGDSRSPLSSSFPSHMGSLVIQLQSRLSSRGRRAPPRRMAGNHAVIHQPEHTPSSIMKETQTW
jgi:hypothetical protein